MCVGISYCNANYIIITLSPCYEAKKKKTDFFATLFSWRIWHRSTWILCGPRVYYRCWQRVTIITLELDIWGIVFTMPRADQSLAKKNINKRIMYARSSCLDRCTIIVHKRRMARLWSTECTQHAAHNRIESHLNRNTYSVNHVENVILKYSGNSHSTIRMMRMCAQILFEFIAILCKWIRFAPIRERFVCAWVSATCVGTHEWIETWKENNDRPNYTTH